MNLSNHSHVRLLHRMMARIYIQKISLSVFSSFLSGGGCQGGFSVEGTAKEPLSLSVSLAAQSLRPAGQEPQGVTVRPRLRLI